MGRFHTGTIVFVIVLIGREFLLCGGHQSRLASSNALIPPARFVLATPPSDNLTTTPMTPLSTPMPSIQPNHHPCTCAVFLGNQFKKGSTNPPTGAPAIRHKLNKTFPCTPIGTKQCQSKCLEVFIRHLPNAGSILCASMDRDCHKEKAYLFVQNCDTNWVNSNLTTGKEYCCKDGLPYQCPLI